MFRASRIPPSFTEEEQIKKVNEVLQLGNGNPSDAMKWAAAKGYVDVVNFFIKNKVNVNRIDAQDKTALMFAAGNGHSEIVTTLIKSRANITAQDKYGLTAIDKAIKANHQDIAEELKSHVRRSKGIASSY